MGRSASAFTNDAHGLAGVCERHGLTRVGTFASSGSQAVWKVRDRSGAARVLKACSAYAFARGEAAALTAWATHGWAPAVETIEDGFLLLDFLEGRNGSQAAAVSNTHARAVGELLGAVLRRAPDGLPSVMEFAAAEQRKLLSRSLVDAELKRFAAGKLRALTQARAGDGDQLVHGDLLDQNIIAGPHGLAMIDPYGLRGNAAFDLARYAACLPDHQEERLEALADGFGTRPRALDDWFAWTAVIRYDNALRYLPAEQGRQRELLVRRLVAG